MGTRQQLQFKEIVWREEPLCTDLEIIREIVESSGFFSVQETRIAVELVEERLNKGTSSGYCFLFAENREKVLGYSCFGPIPCTENSYDLYWIAVKNELRGLGLGEEILKRTEEKIRLSGGNRIYVETSSRAQYGPTQAFYTKCGYSKEAVIKDFYSKGDDKIIYVRFL